MPRSLSSSRSESIGMFMSAPLWSSPFEDRLRGLDPLVRHLDLLSARYFKIDVFPLCFPNVPLEPVTVSYEDLRRLDHCLVTDRAPVVLRGTKSAFDPGGRYLEGVAARDRVSQVEC